MTPQERTIADALVNDGRFFIESSLSIPDKQTNEKSPFIFRPAQEKYWKARTQLDIITKARKEGFSSLIQGEGVHRCATRPHHKAVELAHTDDDTLILFQRVVYMVENCAFPLRVKVNSDNIYFLDTKSIFICNTAGSTGANRGGDVNFLHLSEPAHYPSREAITSSEGAMMGKDWRIVQETTAKGAGTPHHEAVLRAVRGESGWKHHFFGWFEDPTNFLASEPFEMDAYERKLKDEFNLDWGQRAWRRWKLRSMDDPSLFPQENPATFEEAFLATGRMVFDWQAIRRHESAMIPPMWKGHLIDEGSEIRINPDPRRELTIYKMPKEGVPYLIVSDAAQGIKGGDFSVGDVFDMRTWEQVAQWRGHLDPIGYADALAMVGAFYNWALLAQENNPPGNGVLQRLMTRRYPNLYDEPGEPGEDLGWKTTEKSRGNFISMGRAAVRDLDIKINSMATISELRTFIETEAGGRQEAQAGCHDDCVITVCKAADILANMRAEPEIRSVKARDILRHGFSQRRRTDQWGSRSVV